MELTAPLAEGNDLGAAAFLPGTNRLRLSDPYSREEILSTSLSFLAPFDFVHGAVNISTKTIRTRFKASLLGGTSQFSMECFGHDFGC